MGKFRDKLPSSITQPLDRWVEQGEPPSFFLSAVLADRLFECFETGTAEELALLGEVVGFVRTELPIACSGSLQHMIRWRIKREEERKVARAREAQVLGPDGRPLG